MCQEREHERLTFRLADLTQEKEVFYDLLLVMDVVEHVEDVYGFLRGIRGKSEHTIFKIPLDFNVYAAMRQQSLDKSRQQYGHIHHFNCSTALSALRDAGYELLDHFLATPRSDPEMRRRHQLTTLQARVFNSAVQLSWSITPGLASSLFPGGFVVVLAK